MKTAEANREQIARGVYAVLMGDDKPKARVILFGSRARGDAHAGSDWDLLILLDKEQITEADKNTISYPIRELGWDIDQMINPIMYTTHEWEAKRHTPFYKNVMREGIIL